MSNVSFDCNKPVCDCAAFGSKCWLPLAVMAARVELTEGRKLGSTEFQEEYEKVTDHLSSSV